MWNKTRVGLPCRDLKLTRKGDKIPLNSSPKWFKMETSGYQGVMINDNLYGFDAYLNDGRKGCITSKSKLFNTVQSTMLGLIKRRTKV